MSRDLAIPDQAPARARPRAAANLTQRASLNVVASLLDYGAKIAVNFLVIPILVTGLGRSLYGVWEMLGRLVGYLTAGDGRPTQALRLVVASMQASDDDAAKRRYVGAAFVVWILFLPVILAAGAVLVWAAPAITKAPPELHAAVRLGVALLAGGLLFANLASLPESVLRGMNLGYKRMGFQAGLNVIGGLLTAGAIFAGLGLVGVAGAQVALVAITGVCFWILVKHYVTSFGVARPSAHDVRALLGMSAWIAIGEVVAKLALASDVIILGMVVSPALVTTYVLTGYAGRIALGLHVFTTGAAMPGLGGVIGRGEYEWAAGLRAEIMNLTWLFVTAVGATILLWNRSFLTLWVGAENYAGFWTNLLIVIATAQTALVRTDAYVLDATLQPRLRVWVAAVAGAAIVGFSIALTPSLGIVGVCLGVLMGRLVQTIAYPLLVDRCLHRPARLRVRSIARPLTVMLVMFGATAAVGQRVLAHHWLGWAAGVTLSLAIMMAVAFVAGLPAEARGTVLGRLHTMLATARG